MFFTGARSTGFFLYKGHSCRVSIKTVWDNERHIKGIWGAHKTSIPAHNHHSLLLLQLHFQNKTPW